MEPEYATSDFSGAFLIEIVARVTLRSSGVRHSANSPRWIAAWKKPKHDWIETNS
jgi:hypothetical protein